MTKTAIIYYEIVYGYNMDDIEEEINKKIDDDLQPLGGIAVSPSANEDDPTFYQAMVKYENVTL